MGTRELCTTYKILTSISYIKSVPHAEEITEYQVGFRRGRSTFDQIFYYETNIGKILGTPYRCNNIYIFDFQADYDTVRGKEIWSKKRKQGFQIYILLKLCRIINNEIYAKVKFGKQLSPEFKVNKGLRQRNATTFCSLIQCWKLQLRKSRVET